jgi:hypothetical protein
LKASSRAYEKVCEQRSREATKLSNKKASKGAIAQLGEHLLCKQGVVGSIPTGSRKKREEKGWLRSRKRLEDRV